MRSRSDEMFLRAPLSGDVPTWSVRRSKSDPAQADVDLERGCEITIEMDLDGPHPVVSVVGVLARPGGALLAAVLEYVRNQHGGPVAVDLRQVSHIDRHGLAPVIESGAVLAGASSRVERALTGLTMSSVSTEGQRTKPP